MILADQNEVFSSSGHIRDPNNQLQTVKNLRICVSNVVTSPSPSASLGSSQNRHLSEVVFSCQPQEAAQATALRTGDYHLNLNGKFKIFWFVCLELSGYRYLIN